MHDKTTQLIASLAESAAPRPPVSLRSISLRWIVGFVLYAGLLGCFTGIRPDLAIAITRPLFVIELLLLLCLIGSAAFSAVLVAYPDRHQASRMMYLPFPLLAAFFAVLLLEWMHAPPDMLPAGHGPLCLSCISGFALLPGALLLLQMRQLASTRPAMAGALALLASFSLGAFAVRLEEPVDYMPHLILWHYLPMFAAALLGVLIGRWALKW